MAKEDERQGAANKGKGKVEDARELNGGAKNVKDEKTKANGKKDEGPKEGKGACSKQARKVVLVCLRGSMLWVAALTR